LDIDYQRNGNLWIAASQEGWETYVRPLAEHPSVPDKQILSPTEVAHLTGIVRAEGVLGGVLHPAGAQISAPKAVRALASRLRDAGGLIREGTEVEEILVQAGQVRGVRTSRVEVATSTAVVAAGAWAHVLLRRAGYEAPIVPLTATRLISKPVGVPRTAPTISLDEFSFLWVRGHHGRLMWGCDYTSSPHFDFVESDPPHTFDLLDGEAESTTRAQGRRASGVIPLLANPGECAIDHGAPCYTADTRSLVGPVPGIDGLFAVCGCNQAGITHGPGYGRLIAELILDGEAQLTDPAPFDLGRFERKMTQRQIANAATEAVFFA
jgi:glycine/D-amino acid oxidase-like deaminating enzyme